MNKGQIEVSFNWLFIMLAGAAIMFFFYNVINFQIDSSEDQVDRTVSERIRSIFTSLGSTSDSYQVQSGFSQTLEFSCIENSHRFGIQGASSDVELRSELVFTSPLLGGGELLTSTNSLKIPFDVANIVYVSDTSTRYVFVGDTVEYNNFEEIYEVFNITDVDEISDLSEEGYRLTVFIVENDNSLGNSPDINYDHEIINVNEFQNNLKFNTELLRKGYILSAGQDIYDCVEDKIFEQINISSAIYLNKTDKIFSQSSEFCKSRITANDVTTYLNDFIQGDITQDKVDSIVTANNQLDRGGCPWIY